MKYLSRILAVVAALVAVLGLSVATQAANAARLKPTGLTFNTGAPGLGGTAGVSYVPGVTSTHNDADAPPIVITVSGPCTVSGPDAGGFYTVTYGYTSGTCTIKASQAAGDGYAAGSAQQTGWVLAWNW